MLHHYFTVSRKLIRYRHVFGVEGENSYRILNVKWTTGVMHSTPWRNNFQNKHVSFKIQHSTLKYKLTTTLNNGAQWDSYPLSTRRCCDVESTSLMLIQRRNNIVCQVVDHHGDWPRELQLVRDWGSAPGLLSVLPWVCFMSAADRLGSWCAGKANPWLFKGWAKVYDISLTFSRRWPEIFVSGFVMLVKWLH